MTSVMWFRRDLRLADNPALLSAVSAAAGATDPIESNHTGRPARDRQVVPLFVLDPALVQPAGAPRRAYLAASLTDLGSRVGGLQLRCGDPVHEVVAVDRAASATTVHIAQDYGPRGRRRDLDVESALARYGIQLVRTGSPYACRRVGSLTKPVILTRCSPRTPEPQTSGCATNVEGSQRM